MQGLFGVAPLSVTQIFSAACSSSPEGNSYLDIVMIDITITVKQGKYDAYLTCQLLFEKKPNIGTIFEDYGSDGVGALEKKW